MAYLQSYIDQLLRQSVQHTDNWQRAIFQVEEPGIFRKRLEESALASWLPVIGQVLPGEYHPYSKEHDPRQVVSLQYILLIANRFATIDKELKIEFSLLDQKERLNRVEIRWAANEENFLTYNVFFVDWLESGYQGHAYQEKELSDEQVYYLLKIFSECKLKRISEQPIDQQVKEFLPNIDF